MTTSTLLCFSARDEKNLLIQDLRDELESSKVILEKLAEEVCVTGLQLSLSKATDFVKKNTFRTNA